MTTKQRIFAKIRSHCYFSAVLWTIFHQRRFPQLISYQSRSKMWEKTNGRKLSFLYINQRSKTTHRRLITEYSWLHMSANQDETVSSYISKLVWKFQSQMKTYYFDPERPISIIGFSAAYKPGCETSTIQGKFFSFVCSHNIHKTPANTLNSRMSFKYRTVPIIA